MNRLPLAALLLFAACSSAPPTLHDLDYPGTLQPPATLPIEVVWQQQVTASWRQGDDGEVQERSFTAAVQRHGDKLTVLGLSPMGEVGFSIEQTAEGIDVQNHMPEQMRIPPRFILLDVQRVFFPWFDEPVTRGARVQGRFDEEIFERYEHGRLALRTFRRLDGEPEGKIEITYDWRRDDWRAPSRAVLHNGWFGYTLTIDTLSEQRL